MSIIARFLSLLQRWCYWFVVWSLERQFADELACMRQVGDTDEFMRIYRAHQQTRKELAAARSAYSALLPVGKRITWGKA